MNDIVDKRLQQAKGWVDKTRDLLSGRQKLYDEGEDLLEAGRIEEALSRFREASRQRCSKAMIKLGWLYEGNENVPRNKIESGAWYLLASRANKQKNTKWLKIESHFSKAELASVNSRCEELKKFWRK